MKKYEIFLLDLDQTILDFNKSEKSALEFVFKEAKIPFDDNIYNNYHKLNRELWSQYERGEIERSDIFNNRFRLLFEKFNIICKKDLNLKYFKKLAKEAYIMDGAIDFMEFLSKKGRIFIATNGRDEIQNKRIALSGIEKYISGIFVSENIGYIKPQREFFEYIEKHIENFDKEKSVIIGDGLNSDIAGGINYGIDTIWYNPECKQQTEIISTYLAKNYKEIEDIIDSLL
jgi:YjjG family noncanonical pyrimidine nucleotidase